MSKIFLPNDSKSLKVYSINSGSCNEYINQKSIELGAKVEGFSAKEPISYSRIILEGDERIAREIKRTSAYGLKRHSFYEGWSSNPSDKEVIYQIFSEEKPIIKHLLECIELKKNSLKNVTENKLLVWNYFWTNYAVSDMPLTTYFENCSTPTLSFEAIADDKDNEDIIKEFLNFFMLCDNGILEFKTIEDSFRESVELARRISTNSFGHDKITDEIKDSMFEYITQEFNATCEVAKKNEKVLSLKQTIY